MKKKIVLMALACLPILTLAQEERQGRQWKHEPEAMMERMTEKLELSDAQEDQVKELNAQMRARMEELRAEMKQVRENYHENLTEVLNDEQVEKLEEMKKRHEKRMEMHHKKRAPRGGEKGMRHGRDYDDEGDRD